MTTVDQLYSRHRKRWLTAIEKLAALGFPTTDGIAAILKQEPRSQLLVFFALFWIHGCFQVNQLYFLFLLNMDTVSFFIIF